MSSSGYAALVYRCLALVVVAPVRRFGYLDGFAITSAIWLLMPQFAVRS